MKTTEATKTPSKFSIKKAHATQLKLSKKITREDVLPRKIRYVAGVDVAYAGAFSVGAVAVLDYESLSLGEAKTAVCRTLFPYIPTLLSFREIPPIVSAIRKLKLNPDVFIVDGQGIMHPCRLGLASHLGLTIGKPTVGAAKSLLIGGVQPLTNEGWAPILDKGEMIGAAVATGKDRKLLYVSIGNMVSLETAIVIIRHCTQTHTIPEPTRQAHLIANTEKRKMQNMLSTKEGRKGG